jgi:hypothetical protein
VSWYHQWPPTPVLGDALSAPAGSPFVGFTRPTGTKPRAMSIGSLRSLSLLITTARVNRAAKDIDEQVRGDVHVAALFFTTRDRCHESSAGHVDAGGILDHQRPLGCTQHRSSLNTGRPRRSATANGLVATRSSTIHTRSGRRRPFVQVCASSVLVWLGGGVATALHPGGAEDHAKLERTGPVGLQRDE